jgi:hypothetical protein
MRSIEQDLDIARHLVRLGVPVFLAGLAEDGSPRCPLGWQRTERGDLTPADCWEPGLALCAVMGHTFDVLDIDPRHGGAESARQLQSELAGAMPAVYGRTRTPSGGWHSWLAPLGLAKKTGFRDGLDYQGGRPDGDGRGFVFLPPTVRPSKVDGVMRPYSWIEAPTVAPPPDDDSGARLARLITGQDKREAAAWKGVTARPGAVKAASGYIRAALVAELTRVAEAAEGNRNTQLNSSAFALARFVADGLLDADATASALADAAEHAGLGQAEALGTIRSAFTARGAAA